MAEARRGTLPHPALNLSSGIDVNNPSLQTRVSHQGLSIFIPAPRFILRGLIRFIRRKYKQVSHAFMPLPAPIGFSVIFATLAIVLRADSNGHIRNSKFANVLWNFDSMMPWARALSIQSRVAYLTFNTSVVVVGTFTAFHRIVLRGLLSYTRYMDEARGKASLFTKVWGMLLKFIYIRGAKPGTLAYQGSLPKLPLPTLKDTCARYLQSMKPILDQAEYEELAAEADKFIKNEGTKLQGYLKWKYYLSKNYVSDWWLDVVYLRGRESIMIGSNYYGLSLPSQVPTNSQLARAAYVIITVAKAKLEIDRETLPPMLINDLVPICMDQYQRAFSLTREPGVNQDRLVKYAPLESRHIVVNHNGLMYKVQLFSTKTGRLLTPQELYVTLEGIVAAKDVADPAEAALPALTSWNRTKWAETRENCFLRNKVNRSSLASIEKGMIYVVLDNVANESYTEKGKQYLHSDGTKLWLDKSITFSFDTKGDFGLNGEHSWGDAPAAGHMVEYCLAREVKEKPYDEAGNLKPDPKPDPRPCHYPAQRLPWVITDELRDAVGEALGEARTAIADFDLCSNRFEDFGKSRVTKVMKCSPDAFLQMSYQLAYFRETGKFVQTYESAMTRMYVNGRTETIRSQSQEACDFVRAMEDSSVPREEVLKLLRKACEKHTKTTVHAMTGRGVDRHLFSLYVVAVGTNTESPFLSKVLKRGWKLSTSQVPATQAPHMWLEAGVKGDSGDTWHRPSGGFGPVSDDGYGVSYLIGGTKAFHFHVSAKKACPHTDATKMYDRIVTALRDMSGLIADPPATA